MRRARRAASRRTRYGQVALAGEAARVAAAPRGERSDTLNVAAYRLARHVTAGLLTEAEVVEALLDAARASGHVADDGEQAALRTINSGLTAGQQPNSRSL